MNDKVSTSFDDYVRDVEAESSQSELAELEEARARFKVGARILQQRVSAGFTQQQLAALSGVGQAEISRIERGQANPTADTLEALGSPLGISLDLVPTGGG